jgi:hypothetical protein
MPGRERSDSACADLPADETHTEFIACLRAMNIPYIYKTPVIQPDAAASFMTGLKEIVLKEKD